MVESPASAVGIYSGAALTGRPPQLPMAQARANGVAMRVGIEGGWCVGGPISSRGSEPPPTHPLLIYAQV